MARHYENGFLNPTLSASSKNLAERKSNTSLNAIGNRLYDEAGSNSAYNTLQRNTNNAVKPRQLKGPDVVYDNVGPGTDLRNMKDKRSSQPSDKHARQRRRRRDGIIRLVLMFLIVFIAAIAVLLAILLMMGKVGPSCSCNNSGTSPNSQQTTQTAKNRSNQQSNAFAMNLSPFYDILEELQANISSLREEAESVLQDSGRNKDALMAAKREFNSTRDAVNQFSDGFYAIVDHVNNTVQQFNPDHGPIFTQLQALNETLTNELTEMKRTSEQFNDELDKAIDAMNSTISEQVNLKISLPGPVGERGINGSKGPKGDAGPIGLEGPQGAKGPPGEKGNKGSPGNDGYPGANGSKGPRGDKGPQGINGDDGSTGPPGPPGVPGPSGIGNFSWCEVVEVPKAQTASVKDTVDEKVISATCTTELGEEANLDVVKSILNEYKCSCKGSDANAKCTLHYWACPIQAP